MIAFTMPVYVLDSDCAAWIVMQAQARALGLMFHIEWEE